MAIAGIGAIIVFFSVVSYVANVQNQLNPVIQVLTLERPAKRFQSVTVDMVKFTSVPRRFAPKQALTGVSQVAGLVAASDLPVDSILQQGMLLPLPDLRGRERAQTVVVDSASGVAGRLGPDDLVDIQASYEGGRTLVVVSAVRVVSIGVSATGSASADPNGRRGAADPFGGQSQLAQGNAKVPITLALTPQDSLKVGNAIDFARSFRLVQHRPGDNERLRGSDTTFTRGG